MTTLTNPKRIKVGLLPAPSNQNFNSEKIQRQILMKWRLC
ncbi:protein of unknown function [Candidatus Nitrosocosmicus franklandus]|uniref:Uncharacterized protein n=1 Tax=Candidatus Nitrosocosmicus franklandianus TaxID=1798806 RepID=A0A484IB83_9ARCH|nr:protein of unknown function [Candidatus Nitrosocosmicus franklandus]